MWCPLDRLITHLIHHQIKSTFKHVVDEKCAHMQGPSAIKGIHKKIRPEIEKYEYFIRLDVKGFYASVDREILSKMVEETYDDPIMVAYLKDVIHISHDRGGNVYTPKKGIPTSRSLSPFFAALSLKLLDVAFSNRSCFYIRYMNDILLNKKAKRKIYKALRLMKLERSPKKSLMGKLSEKAFHYLGLSYDRTQTDSCPKTQVKVHTRTWPWALTSDTASNDTGQRKLSPVTDQRYLRRWATWWCFDALTLSDNITEWIFFTRTQDPRLVWLGEGLLLR